MIVTTKFNVNETVWFMHRNKVTSGKIIGINLHANSISSHTNYNIDALVSIDKRIFEDQLFRSKEELLKSL